jgi:hypothetical protein
MATWGTRLAATAVVVGMLIAGCGEPPPPVVTPPPTMPAELVADCGSLRLPLPVLTNPLGAEHEDTPEAQALLRFVQARLPAAEGASEDTYRILRSVPGAVLYGSSGETFTLINVNRADDRWTAQPAGSCAPALELPGLNAATWTFDVGMGPDPATQRFVALVSEVPCVGGRPADGRVLAPIVRREATRVLVIFGIDPPAVVGGPAACPRAPATRFEVDLGQPLGNRELLDGSTIPPRDPILVTCCG